MSAPVLHRPEDDILAHIGGDAGSSIVPSAVVAIATGPAPTSGLTQVLTIDGARGPLSGQRWPGYEIGDLLGCGGMAEVYRAWQIAVGRTVALKAMPAGVSDPGLRARFAIEAGAAARIDSPFVVRIHDSGEEAGRMWLAMEYVAGRSLAERLRERGALPPAEAGRLALQAARGLAAAHAMLLVHRDIKPANLLLAADGTVKVADFGLVRIVDGRTLTRTGTILGTPQYLAPEQGRGLTTGPSGDVYSLGVVLYELLTGRPPFDGDTADALIFQHNFAEPPLPATVNPEVPQDLQAVCLKCLQKDPLRRYADGAALVDDLARVLAGLAPASAVFAPGELGTGAAEALRQAGGQRRRWLPAALLLTAIAAAGVWWWAAERRTTIGELRARLAPVALAAPVPATASGDLDRLQSYVGADDPLVEAGRRKLAAISAQVAELDAALASGAAGQVGNGLDHLAELVGRDGDPRMERWRGWLAGQSSRLEALRARLAPELAGQDTIPRALRDRIGGELAAFLAGAPATDPDRSAWQRLLERSDAVAAGLRRQFARCGDPAPLTARELSDLAAAGQALAALAGAEAIDPAWQARIAADGQEIAVAQGRIARFLALTAPTAADCHEARAAGAALQARQALGPAEAADLGQRLAAAEQRLADLAALRTRIAALDDAAGPLPADADALVEALAALAGGQDAQVGRLRQRLASQRRLEAELDGWSGLVVLPDADAAVAALASYRVLAGDDARATRAAARLVELRPDPPAWAAAAGADAHGPWCELAVDGARLRLRWLPPVTGLIGSPPAEAGRSGDEPEVAVRLSRGLWIADRECPQALWSAVMGANPARSRDPALPVESVSAAEVEDFCARLAVRLPGCAARLPSEAEWELAMRAGAAGAYGAIPGAQADAAIVHRGQGLTAPRPTGLGPANPLGLHDGPGNVWEWCAGAYGPQPTGNPAVDPQPPAGPKRVARGGSWGDALGSCRLARRLALDPGTRSCYLGFRLAVDGGRR